MRVLHKHAHHHPLLSFPRVKSEFTLGKLWVYPTQTPSLLRPIGKCINMQFEKGKGDCQRGGNCLILELYYFAT